MNNIFEFLTPKDSTFFIEADCTLRQALEKFCFHKFTVVPILKEMASMLVAFRKATFCATSRVLESST